MIVRTLGLFVVWLTLSQSLDAFYLGLGLAASLFVSWLHAAPPGGASLRWSALAAYLPWLLWQVLLSGVHLAYLILHPRLPIDPKLIHYRTALSRPAAIALFGNSITLTPGTITAEAGPGELVIHAMDDASAAGLANMEARVAGVFAGTGAAS